jgi:hypothetical protein
MEKLRKFGKYKISYYLEADKIFNVEDRSIDETEFIDECLDKMSIDLETEENEDIILSKRQIIYLLTAIVREWDTFKESSYKLLPSEKRKPMGKTENSDFKYLKLSEILATDEILTNLEIDDPNKMKFIRDYLNDRLNVDVNKDDLIVFEPIDISHLIVMIYDIVKTFENETQKLP